MTDNHDVEQELEERVDHWIETQHGTAGWQTKLKNLIAQEKERSRREGEEAAYRKIIKSIGEKPKRKTSGFYNTMINAEVDGFNKCLWRVKKICHQLLTPPETTATKESALKTAVEYSVERYGETYKALEKND